MAQNTKINAMFQLEDVGASSFESLIKHLHNAIVVTQIPSLLNMKQSQPNIIWANDAFYKLCAYCPSEVIGHSALLLQGSLTDNLSLSQLLNALVKGEHCHVELISYKKDGTPFWNELDVSPIGNAAGVFTHCILLCKDISERKEQEAKLQASEALFKTLSGTAPTGIFTSDAEGACTYTNKRWQQIFDLSYDDSLGSGWHAGIHPDDRQKVYENWLLNAQSKAEFDFQFRT